MAKKRVIAYYMHEPEREAAEKVLSASQSTDSFAVGEIEDSEIEKLKQKGVIVIEEQGMAREERDSEEVKKVAALESAPGRQFAAELGGDTIPALEDYYNLRLRGPLLETWRQQLKAIGVTILEKVSGGYKVRLKSDQVAAVTALDCVADLRWITPAEAAPRIVTRAVPPSKGLIGGAQMLTFDVRLNRVEDREKVEGWLREKHLTIAGASRRKIRFFATRDDPTLGQLACLPEVDVIAEYIAPKLCNDVARRLLRVDGPVGNNPATNVLQDGTDQIVAVADTGIDDQHPDFAGRIIGRVALGRQNDWSDPNGHGTHVAGSVLGDGNASGGQVKGVAPKAKLFFQSLLDSKGELGGLPLDLNDLFDAAYKAGARIHNNSWGAATPSRYTINSEEVDEFVKKNPDMLIVVAAGNEGTGANPVKAAQGFVDWLSIGSPASCKNALTVGASRSDRADGPMRNTTWKQGWPNLYPQDPIAKETISGDADCLAAFSSRGPCDDRRIKPDVVAPGTDIASTRSSLAPLSNFWGPYPTPPAQPLNGFYAYDGGTSMATPLVSGCAALVRQYYVQRRNHEPSAALLKATLINSTVWLKGADSIAPTMGQPNYHQGFGRISMELAIPNPAQPGLELQFVDNWKDPNAWFTRTGERRRFQFVLGQDAPELRICMAYTDAPARALQNNLNLMLQHVESQQKWLGNTNLPDALILPDPDNNVEVVRLTPAKKGTYLIQIFVSNMLKPPQDFSLVVSGMGVPVLNQI
jgi:serine protease AprX